jgi:hypothetical protein
MWQNEDEIKQEPDYKVYETISTLFAIVFCVGLFIKFLFF